MRRRWGTTHPKPSSFGASVGGGGGGSGAGAGLVVWYGIFARQEAEERYNSFYFRSVPPPAPRRLMGSSFILARLSAASGVREELTQCRGYKANINLEILVLIIHQAPASTGWGIKFPRNLLMKFNFGALQRQFQLVYAVSLVTVTQPVSLPVGHELRKSSRCHWLAPFS